MRQINRLVILLLVIGIIDYGFAQSKSVADSPLLRFRIAKEVKHPLLKIVDGPHFVDTDGNNVIDANEECKIIMKITNIGEGEGLGPTAKIEAKGAINGISYSGKNLANIPIGDTISIEYPIKTDMNTADGSVIFTVYVDEPYGFGGTRKESTKIYTRKFQEPLVVVTDYDASKEGGGSLMKGESFMLKVMVQNVAQHGVAEDVQVELKSLNSMAYISGDYLYAWPKLSAFEKREISFKLFINDRYEGSELPLAVKISEKYGKYARDTVITLHLNQSLANSITEVVPQVAQVKNAKKATIRSDVDKDIPITGEDYPNKYAIIIGNWDYNSQQSIDRREQNVPYADVDANVFKEYCVKILGIEERHIRLCINANKKEMSKAIAAITTLAADKANSEIIFYYAGHGLPDKDSIPYLIPVDADANTLDEAIPLYELLDQLSETNAQRVTVFLDACFTGAGRDGSLLVTRGLIKTPKKNALNGNIVVFSATSAEQVALPYESGKHGMFTYFLLKKLQDSKGKCTYSELFEYLRDNVFEQSISDYDIRQTPEVRTGPWVKESWGEWRFIEE